MERVAFIIPTLNEAPSIGSVIESIPATELAENGYETSVYVVDGRSVDHTRDVPYFRKFELTQGSQNAGLGDCCGS